MILFWIKLRQIKDMLIRQSDSNIISKSTFKGQNERAFDFVSSTSFSKKKYDSDSRTKKEISNKNKSYSSSNSEQNSSSSSSYSDKSSLLYPYTINEIIKGKYMVINIYYN